MHSYRDAFEDSDIDRFVRNSPALGGSGKNFLQISNFNPVAEGYIHFFSTVVRKRDKQQMSCCY